MGDWEAWAAGATAGTCMSLIGHPFDTVKTRMQTTTSYRSSWACALAVSRQEGIFALWKGLGPALLGSASTSSIRFGVQSWANSAIARQMHCGDFAQLSLPIRATSEAAGGVVAGLVLPMVFTPLEMVKCRQQTTLGRSGGTALQIVRDVVRTEGLRGIYVGHTMTVLRSTSANAGLFGPYCVAKDGLGHVFGEDSLLVRPLSGMIAGWSTWLVSFPFDSVKTRIQVAGNRTVGATTVETSIDLRGMGVSDALKQLWREGALYRGFGPVLLRALPVHIAYLPVFDIVAAQLCSFT